MQDIELAAASGAPFEVSETEAVEPRPRTLAPLGRRQAEVVASEEVGAYRLISVADSRGPAKPVPGQFYMLATVSGWGAVDRERPFLPRAFSYARARAGRGGATLAFLLDEVGPGTARLAQVRRGDRLWLTGPLGVGFRASSDARPVLVGGGIGVAPLLCWQEALNGRATTLLGFRSANHARAASLFSRPRIATDDGSVGRRGPVTVLLAEELTRGGPATVYACGPPALLDAVRTLCRQHQTPAQLALEAPMACGFGACFGCAVPTVSGYARVCVDGPVLDADELAGGLEPTSEGV